MRTIRNLFAILSVLLLIVTFATKSHAQTAASSQRWVCLQADWCGNGTTQCRSTSSDPFHIYHTAKLSAKPDLKLLSNMTTYVVECLSTGGQTMCSTGNAASDMTLYGQDNSAKMKASTGYIFEQLVSANDGVTKEVNPTKSNAAGDIGPFEWTSKTTDEVARKFLAVNLFDGTFADPGASGGQQQGTLDFETSAKDCSAINWDPYGRVFDSKTLEPLKGVSVQLQKKRDTGSFTPFLSSEVLGGAIINPQLTDADGEFSFVVPDATYHLVPTVAGYKFPVDSVSTLGADYAKTYADIYPATTGADIIQKGGIVHRDIPMEAVGASQNNPVEMMEYFQSSDPLTGADILEGRMSHPFATVNVWTAKTDSTGKVASHYRKIVSVQSDKSGYFKLTVNKKDYEVGEQIDEVEMVKKTTTTPQANSGSNLWDRLMALIVPQVSAQTKNPTIKLDPIPSYVEGIAYDASGRPMAEATVGAYLTFSNKPYYTTTTDANGMFKITSEHLPFLPFGLRYTAKTGAVTNVTTTKFLSQNAKYIADNHVNVNQYKDGKGRTGDQVISMKNAASNAARELAAKNGQTAMSQPQNNFIVVIIVIMLLVVIAVLLVLYLRNAKKTPPVNI